MQIRPRHRLPIGLVALSVLVTSPACNKTSAPAQPAEGSETGSTPATPAEDASPEAAPSPSQADTDAQQAAPTEDPATGGVDAPSKVAPAGADAEHEAAANDAPPPAEAHGGTTGGAEDDPQTQIKALTAEIVKTATTDERALAAAQEAIDLGASVGVVGRAVNRRAARLFKTPERAAAMYEWSRERYTNSPAASFALAKLACTAGDIDAAKTLLHEVKARGGDEQLQTISFDPTFVLVVNEPEIQALLR